MQDLILYIVKNLVTNPDAVKVEEQHDQGQVNLLLTVDPVDMGLIIGKGGNTIKAIRKVLIVKAMADNVRVNLQLAEPEGGRPEKSADQQDSESAESVDQPTSEPEDTATPEDGNTDDTENADTPPTDQAEDTDTPTPAETPPQESDSSEESESK